MLIKFKTSKDSTIFAKTDLGLLYKRITKTAIELYRFELGEEDPVCIKNNDGTIFLDSSTIVSAIQNDKNQTNSAVCKFLNLKQDTLRKLILNGSIKKIK